VATRRRSARNAKPPAAPAVEAVAGRTPDPPGRGACLASSPSVRIPASGKSEKSVTLRAGGRNVTLTNLGKPFWPELGITKGDLIQYYADVATVLLPHLKGRAMVMRRYPNGAAGKSFFMK